jgi:hypothetical protein
LTKHPSKTQRVDPSLSQPLDLIYGAEAGDVGGQVGKYREISKNDYLALSVELRRWRENQG